MHIQNKMLLNLTKSCGRTVPKRTFITWIVHMFNKVDEERLKQLGPDRVCAEWVLRNGGAVRWLHTDEFMNDYNALPSEEIPVIIEAIDATGSAIHHYGFPHFNGCKHIEELKLVRCSYIENAAIPFISAINDSLKHLEIIQCHNITYQGLADLKLLTNLKSLKIGGMTYVTDKSKVLSDLTAALPNCDITYVD